MTRPLDQSLLETVTALVDGLEHANVSYCLIGALVPELLLTTPPPRRTNDADAVVQVETFEEFERVKSALEREPYRFTRTRGPFRMALGATTNAVRWMFVRQGGLVALLGVVVGALAAAGLTRYIQTLLFGVGRMDLVAFAGMSSVMLAVALLASYIPARRASRVDPVVALRAE